MFSKKIVYRLLYSVFILLLVFLIYEIILRVINNDPPEWIALEEYNIVRNIKFSFKSNHSYTPNPIDITYERNNFGLRDNCLNPASIDILTIGGSTTDQKFVKFEKTYQFILQNLISNYIKKDICISNAGVDGHSTHGHIFSLKNWFPLIDGLNPKIYILYIGINDADFNFAIEPILGFDKNKKDLKFYLKKSFVIKKLLPLYRVLKNLINPNINIYQLNVYKTFSDNDFTVSKLSNETKDKSKKNAFAFKNRLKIIIETIKSRNSIPICVSQPHQYIKYVNGQKMGMPKVLGGKLSGLDFDFSLIEINKAMKEICGQFFIDLYSEKFSDKFFYDGVHTNNEGSDHIGNLLFHKMNEKNLLIYLK